MSWKHFAEKCVILSDKSWGCSKYIIILYITRFVKKAICPQLCALCEKKASGLENINNSKIQE